MTICLQPKSRDQQPANLVRDDYQHQFLSPSVMPSNSLVLKQSDSRRVDDLLGEKKMSRDDKNKKGKNSTTTVTWDAARPITFKLRTFRFKKFKFRILIHFKLKTIKNDNNSNLRMFTWINCKMHFFTVMETWAHIIPRLVYISPWQTRFLCILIFFPDENLHRQEH